MDRDSYFKTISFIYFFFSMIKENFFLKNAQIIYNKKIK